MINNYIQGETKRGKTDKLVCENVNLKEVV